MMTKKENDILEMAEDVIMREISSVLQKPEPLINCDSLQTLVGTLDRIIRIKEGRRKD